MLDVAFDVDSIKQTMTNLIAVVHGSLSSFQYCYVCTCNMQTSVANTFKLGEKRCMIIGDLSIGYRVCVQL